jgi:hypothetical protein
VLGDEHVNTLLSAMGNLVVTCREIGDNRALELEECILVGQKQVLGDEHPDTMLCQII